MRASIARGLRCLPTTKPPSRNRGRDKSGGFEELEVWMSAFRPLSMHRMFPYGNTREAPGLRNGGRADEATLRACCAGPEVASAKKTTQAQHAVHPTPGH